MVAPSAAQRDTEEEKKKDMLHNVLFLTTARPLTGHEMERVVVVLLLHVRTKFLTLPSGLLDVTSADFFCTVDERERCMFLVHRQKLTWFFVQTGKKRELVVVIKGVRSLLFP